MNREANVIAALVADAALCLQQGRADLAQRLCRLLLSADPGHAEGWHLLGMTALRRNDSSAAILAIGRAVAIHPSSSVFYGNLGNAFAVGNDVNAAAACFRQCLILNPASVGAFYNLGNTFRQIGRLPVAAVHFRRAVTVAPDHVDSWNNLGSLLQQWGCLADAQSCYRRAVTISPQHVQAYNNLGTVYQAQAMTDRAATCFRHALAIHPGYTEADYNLSLALFEQGDIGQAVARLEAMAAREPGHVPAAMLGVIIKLYDGSPDLRDLLQAARRWVRLAGLDGPAAITRATECRAETRLRVGFVSGDLRSHAVAFLVIPALEELTRRGVQTVCYSNCAQTDAVTERIKRGTTAWRSIVGMTDQQVARQIHDDGIGILFDLSGYSRFNRLPLFAVKPAPIQIAWVGYPATTGLPAMDYLLADRYQVPDGAEVHYQEQVVRLPHSYVCFQPPDDAPQVSILPAVASGGITFASFNVLKKVSPATIALWCRVLSHVPQSRLLLKAQGLDGPETRERYRTLFAERGIAPERVSLIGRTSRLDHLAAMGQVDIALDTFPYSGGQTTLEALWMGVPVITLPGASFASRHSLGYLSTVGLSELVAGSPAQYVALACDLANDRQRLAALRAGLRERMLASPLCDVRAFGDYLTAALMRIWQLSRDGQPPRGFSVEA
jgi:predicted O-linked N-acetylglucosamine transferase (SPINDLY family)